MAAPGSVVLLNPSRERISAVLSVHIVVVVHKALVEEHLNRVVRLFDLHLNLFLRPASSRNSRVELRRDLQLGSEFHLAPDGKSDRLEVGLRVGLDLGSDREELSGVSSAATRSRDRLCPLVS